MQYANRALRESENAGYETGKAKVLYNIGEINESNNLYDIAIGYYNASLDIYKNLEDDHGIASLFFSLANIYKKKAAYKLSLENSLEALKLFEKLKDNSGLADVYNCMGSLLLTKIMKKKWDSIENDNFQKNLDLNKMQRSHAINTKSKDTSNKEMKECSQISFRWSIGRPFTLIHSL